MNITKGLLLATVLTTFNMGLQASDPELERDFAMYLKLQEQRGQLDVLDPDNETLRHEMAKMENNNFRLSDAINSGQFARWKDKKVRDSAAAQLREEQQKAKEVANAAIREQLDTIQQQITNDPSPENVKVQLQALKALEKRVMPDSYADAYSNNKELLMEYQDIRRRTNKILETTPEVQAALAALRADLDARETKFNNTASDEDLLAQYQDLTKFGEGHFSSFGGIEGAFASGGVGLLASQYDDLIKTMSNRVAPILKKKDAEAYARYLKENQEKLDKQKAAEAAQAQELLAPFDDKLNEIAIRVDNPKITLDQLSEILDNELDPLFPEWQERLVNSEELGRRLMEKYKDLSTKASDRWNKLSDAALSENTSQTKS